MKRFQLICAVTCFLIAAIHLFGCGANGALSETAAANSTAGTEALEGSTVTTSPVEQTAQDVSEEALEKYEQILFEGGSFRAAPGGKVFSLESYCAENFSGGVSPNKYCYADLDQDGTAELILCLSEQDAELVLLVFQCKDHAAIAYDFTPRQMYDLKQDGTFGYSGGIADTGYASLCFTGGSWKYEKICNVTENDEGVSFFCNGEPASEEMYWACVSEQNAKEGAEWTEYLPDAATPGQTESKSMTEDPAAYTGGEKRSTLKTEVEEQLRLALENQYPILFDDAAEGITLSSYCAEESERLGFSVEITRYALLDMDGDSISECVVDFRFGENEQVMCLVLKYENGTIYATGFYYRQMYQLKSDGTFGASGGAGDSGWYRLVWENMSWIRERVPDEESSESKQDAPWQIYDLVS